MRRTHALSALCLALALTSCDQRESQPIASSAPATPAASRNLARASAPSAPSAPPSSPAPRPAGMFEHVYIYDIDWRSGGRALFLRGDGSGIARVAGALENNVQNEKRYELAPSPERAEKIRAALDAHRAAAMKVESTHAPGDQLAIVRMLPETGPELTLRGPTGKNEAFRKLLLELGKVMEGISFAGLSPAYDGAFDPHWSAPFASPRAIVSRHELGPLKGGKLHPVATLAFDRRNSATLTISEPGEDADRVKRAWHEIALRDPLSVKSDQEVGTEHRMTGKTVRRDDKDYPAAVRDVLSGEFGIFAVEQKL